MKHIAAIILTAAMLLGSVSTAEAQRRATKPADRTELARRQAERIADQLAFDATTAERFIDTYTRCQQEKWALGKPGATTGRLTEAQTDSMLRARFDRSRRLLDLREKYYREYRKFLTAKQVDRIYQLEQRQGDTLSSRHRAVRQAKQARKARQTRQPKQPATR